MANGALSFPFRLTPTGSAATVATGSDAEIDEAIAVLCLTRLGERHMRPSFGTPDPVFAGGLFIGDIQVGLNEHGPEGVTITDLAMTPINTTKALAEITYSREGEEDAAR